MKLGMRIKSNLKKMNGSEGFQRTRLLKGNLISKENKYIKYNDEGLLKNDACTNRTIEGP